jgi:hypothetical protein
MTICFSILNCSPVAIYTVIAILLAKHGAREVLTAGCWNNTVEYYCLIFLLQWFRFVLDFSIKCKHLLSDIGEGQLQVETIVYSHKFRSQYRLSKG